MIKRGSDSFTNVHPTWIPILERSLSQVDPTYLSSLQSDNTWLPGWDNFLNAFSLPLPNLKAILFGESPYPRAESANGYAFWDGAVGDIWSEKGLSKPVNRATSLRNFIKMLLVTEGSLEPEHTGQPAIAALPKTHYVQTLGKLFQHMLDAGILLLNTSLVLSQRPVPREAKAWRPFLASLLADLHQSHPDTHLLLFGRIAGDLKTLPHTQDFPHLEAEHPYNLSFIQNPQVQQYFQPLQLLKK